MLQRRHPLCRLGAVENDARGPLAAAMAKAYTSDAYMAVAQRSIQIFGAIGFTWEMVNHLYFKRARANAELFGSARSAARPRDRHGREEGRMTVAS